MTVLREYAAALSQPSLLGRDTRPAAYDEVVGPDGRLRAAWRPLAEQAVGLTADDLHRVDEDITRFLADDGVTYALPGQPPEPWRLDPMPLVVDAESWAALEVGLAQRGELLNALLRDLYGDQSLLSEGVLPAALVLGHAGFTRVVARSSTRDPRPLVLAATDLGRDAEGQWRVLGDRTQAPSGIGYAMENRRVISRVLPELYRETGLHRMEPWFGALRSALIQSATGDLADPRVVVLSPGVQSETAYDQAFVASILGFPLVQGTDLVVRDGWVMMRVLGRLERVDVILRRVDSAYADPLELRGDSQLGVAGLVEAVRRGRVRVVNGLGAGVLENPGLLPYLPAACERLLGEPLRLAAVPTWWCGDPESLDRVLDRVDSLVVRPVDGPASSLVGLDRAALQARLLATPHRYVGQERLSLSQAPTWPGSGLTSATSRRVTLRTFTLRYGSAYRPLVGGLASVRDPAGPHSWQGPGQLGGVVSTKDVWVLKPDATAPDQGMADVPAMATTRAVNGLVPRTLEDLFWIGRYAERAEDVLRLVLAAHALADDFSARPGTSGGAVLEALMRTVTRLAGPPVGHGDDREDERAGDLDPEFRSLLLDEHRNGSAAHAITGLRRSAQGVREQLSGDTWRGLGVVERATAALEESPHSHQVAESAGRMLTGLLALHGVSSSMIRDAGWHLMCAGRSLERGIQLCRLLRDTTTVRRGLDVDRQVLNAVLAASESAVTHRRRYRGYVRPAGVLDLLLMDPDNPRSLAFALAELRSHLAAVPASTGSSRPERLLADLAAGVAATDVASLVAIGGADRPNLATFLDSTLDSLERLSDAVEELHFASGPAPRLLSSVVVA